MSTRCSGPRASGGPTAAATAASPAMGRISTVMSLTRPSEPKRRMSTPSTGGQAVGVQVREGGPAGAGARPLVDRLPLRSHRAIALPHPAVRAVGLDHGPAEVKAPARDLHPLA